jgi:hypothetical protein
MDVLQAHPSRTDSLTKYLTRLPHQPAHPHLLDTDLRIVQCRQPICSTNEAVLVQRLSDGILQNVAALTELLEAAATASACI